MAKVFQIKAPTFERLVVGFIRVMALRMSKLFVECVADIYSMTHLIEKSKKFRNCKFALEAIDVTY